MQKTFKTITEMTRKPPKQLLPDASDRPNIHEIVPTWDWPSEYPWNRSHRWPSEYAWNRSHRGSPLRTIAEIVRVGYAVRNTFCTGYAKYAKTTCAQRNGTTLSCNVAAPTQCVIPPCTVTLRSNYGQQRMHIIKKMALHSTKFLLPAKMSAQTL